MSNIEKLKRELIPYNEQVPHNLVFHKVPGDLVHIRCVIGAGSFFDRLGGGKAGVAHFLEHALFKGTKNRTREEFKKSLNNAGDVNAFTGQDITCFLSTCNKEAWRETLNLLLEMISSPAFPEKEIKSERGVILSELNSSRANLETNVYEKIFEDLFPDSGGSVLGDEESISSMTPEDLRSFHESHYKRNNVLISIAGDLSEREIDGLRSETIPSYLNERRKSNLSFFNPNLENMEFEVEEYPDSRLQYLFKAGDASECIKNVEVYSVLSEILSGGLGSVMFEELRNRKGLCYFHAASHMIMGGNFFFDVSAKTEYSKFDDLCEGVDDILGNLDKFVSEDYFESCKENALMELRNAQYHPASVASKSDLFFVTGVLDPEDGFEKRLRRLTMEDVFGTLESMVGSSSVKHITVNA